MADLSEVLPDDFEDREMFVKKFGTVEAVTKAWREADKLINSGAPRLPKEGDAAGWAKVFTAMGRPETPDGYELPEAPETDLELYKSLLPVAHEAGVTNAQLKKLLGAASEQSGSRRQQAEKALEDAKAANEATLRQKLGGDFDATQAYVQRWMKDTFGDEKAGAYRSLGLDVHPEMQAILSEAAKAAGPSRAPALFNGTKGDSVGDLKGMAREWMAIQQSKEIKAGRRDPGYLDAVERGNEVARKIYESGHQGPISDLLKPQERQLTGKTS